MPAAATGQGISVGDAVLTFLGDTTQLNQSFDQTEAKGQAWSQAMNTQMSSLQAAIQDLTATIKGAGDGFDSLPARVRPAGEAVGSSMREARGAIALMGEEIGVHVPRHIQTFLAGLPGVSAAMSAAFAPLAIFALVEIITKAIEKLKEWNEAEEKAKAASDALTSSVADRADALKLANAQLQAAIDKFNGKPSNNLQIALDEARVKADELAKSLTNDVTQLQALLDREKISFFQRFLFGNAGNSDVEATLKEQLGKIQQTIRAGKEQIRQATETGDLSKVQEAQAQAAANEQKAYGDAVLYVSKQLDAATAAQERFNHNRTTTDLKSLEVDPGTDRVTNEDQTKRIDMLNDALGHLKDLQDTAALSAANLSLNLKKWMEPPKGSGANDVEKQAQAILDAQKTVGDATIELIKSQDIQKIEEQERTISLQNATSKQDFAQQLNTLTQLDLQKRAIQAKADDDAYQLQLTTLQAKLAALQKSGKDTAAEQTKINAEIEALEFKHHAALVDAATKAMATLRQVMSQPIPLITEPLPDNGLIVNQFTKGMDQAEEAAQSLGITLGSHLHASLEKAFDDYSKLEGLLKLGVVTQKDVDNGYIKLVQAQLDFAKATGASATQVALLQKELDNLTHKETQAVNDFGKRAHITWEQFISDLKAAKDGTLQQGLAMQEMSNFGISAFNAMTQGLENSVAAAIQGQKSFGQALEQATAQALSSLAAQALVKALFYTAEGFAALASFDYTGASQFFEAAGIMGAVGGAAAVAGHALAGAASGGSSSAPTGTAAPSKSSAGTTASPQPVQVVNTQHLAAGGLVTSPTLAVIGDSASGGGAEEAILPLSDRLATDRIASALLPAIMRAAATTSLLSPGTRAAAGALNANDTHAPDQTVQLLQKFFGQGFANKVSQQQRTDHHVHITLESDISQTVKKINSGVKSGRLHLEASNSVRLTRKS